MDIKILPRPNRSKTKINYTLEWGKGPGQRLATGIYTYTKPKDQRITLLIGKTNVTHNDIEVAPKQ
jgi:hypothetical protein